MDKYQEILKKYNYTPDQLNTGSGSKSVSPSQRIAELQGLSGSVGESAPLKTSGVLGKVSDFVGTTKLGQGIATTILQPQLQKQLEEDLATKSELQGALIERIQKRKAEGADTSRLEKGLKDITSQIQQVGQNAGLTVNPFDLTAKEVIGSGLQTATTIVGAGALPGQVSKVAGAKSIGQGILQGAKEGVISGGAFGASTGFAQGLIDNKSTKQAFEEGLTGGALGAVGGGVLGGVLGGVSGGLAGRKLNQAVIAAQEANGLRPTLSETVKVKALTDPGFSKIVKEAQKQGFNEKEINLLATLSEADKPTIKKMYEATVKAQSNPRQIVRAADILGENATNIAKQVQNQNSIAGKAVDTTAKALKGQLIDATPVRTTALDLLQEAGVTANANGTPNWTKSIFNKTPALKNKLSKALSDLPAGEMDAYDLHQFKKSIDEFVNYGVGGEGLKGKSASILKAIRAEADNVLDSAFSDYNIANTDYKQTRDFLDEVRSVVGKNVDFSTKQGAQAFGQSFRSAFSNNKSRGATLKLIEDLQNIAKERGLTGAEQNLLDQALYVNILEEVFGSQAATGLSGEVTKALNKAKTAANVVRNPIMGGLEVAATQIEKAQNITPEAKRAILGSFSN